VFIAAGGARTGIVWSIAEQYYTRESRGLG
jgi:hypothetical protein